MTIPFLEIRKMLLENLSEPKSTQVCLLQSLHYIYRKGCGMWDCLVLAVKDPRERPHIQRACVALDCVGGESTHLLIFSTQH